MSSRASTDHAGGSELHHDGFGQSVDPSSAGQSTFEPAMASVLSTLASGRSSKGRPETDRIDLMRAELAPRIPLQPSVQMHLPPLAAYDQLVGVRS